jgi:hypothetical protein
MAMHPGLWGKFVTNIYVRDLVHAGIARVGADGGVFTLPGYLSIKVITDYGLTATPTGSFGPLVGDSSAPGVVLGLGLLRRLSIVTRRLGMMRMSSDSTLSHSLSSMMPSIKSVPNFFHFIFITNWSFMY